MFRKLSIVALTAALVAAPLPVLAQSKKDSVVMALTLEPPGLDPTNAAAAAIAEVTLYNIYETLTKINEDGSVSPLLASLASGVEEHNAGALAHLSSDEAYSCSGGLNSRHPRALQARLLRVRWPRCINHRRPPTHRLSDGRPPRSGMP